MFDDEQEIGLEALRMYVERLGRKLLPRYQDAFERVQKRSSTLVHRSDLKAPFPWFGGKSMVADLVWQRFGDIPNYVEPFAGSLAILLGRPTIPKIETVNDLDGFIANFWRAVASDPDSVVYYADWPVNECDLHARHCWLLDRREDLVARLMGDPDYFDVKIAGWWVWGICSWIGSGWCSGGGPWRSVDGKLAKPGNAGRGVHRKRPHLSNAGRGVHRKRPHLGNAGHGVHRTRPHLSDAGRGVHRNTPLLEWFDTLAARLRRVRVCCGDWKRVCGTAGTTYIGITGMFLDPPYSKTIRNSALYSIDTDPAQQCREWALEHGDDPKMRIALCGYEGEHDMPDTWECVAWKTSGGYGNQGNSAGRANRNKERIWFSPHCLKVGAKPLFT